MIRQAKSRIEAGLGLGTSTSATGCKISADVVRGFRKQGALDPVFTLDKPFSLISLAMKNSQTIK